MDYDLKPLGKTCAKTGKQLEPGSVCFSTVVDRGGERVRLDFSADAWNGPPEGAVGFWKCAVPPKAEIKRRTLDAETLQREFERMCEDANPAEDRLRFVIGLLLVQRRRLRIDETRPGADGTWLHLCGMHGEGPFAVRDPQLNDAEIEELQNEWAAKFAATEEHAVQENAAE